MMSSWVTAQCDCHDQHYWPVPATAAATTAAVNQPCITRSWLGSIWAAGAARFGWPATS
jgi:hypothetical protein